MLVLGLDIETTGLDFEKDEIVEIGAVLWDTQTSKPISVVSLLISDNEMLITEDSQKIHGISKQDCQYGVLLTEAMGTVMGMWQHAEFVVAHNGRQFDLPFMESIANRVYGLMIPVGFFDSKKWIDTMVDVPYPSEYHVRNLRHLAADHGFLNPFAHRAVFDVLTMLTIMSKYDLDEIVELSQEPLFMIYAVCSPPWTDNGVSSNEARKNGFRWNVELKLWTKQIRERQWDQEQQKATAYKLRRI